MFRSIFLASAVLVAIGFAAAPHSSMARSLEPCVTSQHKPNGGVFADPVVQMDLSRLRRFDDAFAFLSKQTRTMIVCEGQPLRAELSEAQVRKTMEELGASGLPLTQTMERLAAAFDYDAVRTGPNVFLLTKLYSDPEDLPDLTLDEVATSLRNILQSARNFYPEVENEVLIGQILQSASASQKEQLVKGVPVSQLSPGQRRMAWQFAGGLVFQPLENILKVSRRLQGCRSPKASFTKKPYWNLVLPAYEGPFGPKGAMRNVALSSWVNTQSGGGTTFDGTSGVKMVEMAGGNQIISAPNVTDPTTPRASRQDSTPASSALKRSLGEVVEQVNERLTASGKADVAAQVTPALAPKSVCVVGEQFVSPLALLQAAADVYGLSLRRTSDAARITQPGLRIVADPKNFGAEIRRLLPAPFLRAVNGASPSTDNSLSVENSQDIYIASVRRLREIVEPKIEVRNTLPMREAGAEALNLVAVSSLATCVSNFVRLMRPVAGYITNFENATIALVPGNEGRPNAVGFTIKLVDAEGKGSGISGEIASPSFNFVK